MNSETQSMNASKYEKKCNKQINNHSNTDNQITNTRQIFNNLNQSIQQKQKLDSSSTSHTSYSLAKHNNAVDKCKTNKLVDSKQVSGPFNQIDKKTFLLDTYARIVANNNRRCPKRLRELAKPKRQARSNQNNYDVNFDLNYGHVTKQYHTENKHNLRAKK
ncbi:hypothetical protein PUN28_002635 [Cardiocondyla obscurior]|uniref:Uncharacterized protein n=1 Tax=Cardiocondyla obscurior TaxID=286306 RepID=A0AAW2GVK0_9HYME